MARLRLRNATDLRINLDHIAAPTASRQWIFLDGCEPWVAQEHVDAMVAEAEHLAPSEAALEEQTPCPVCGGKDLPPSRYCSACDRAGLDRLVDRGKLAYPGLRPNTAPNPDWPETPPAYRPDPVLRGGR
jgi:CTP:molybdopterin cytidylyltransferase MocA